MRVRIRRFAVGADLVAGQVQGAFNTASPLAVHVKSGKLRALATQRNAASSHPKAATIAESGVPGYEVSVWYAVFAPRAVPGRIVELWNAEINRMLKLPETKDLFFVNGMSAIGGTAREANEYFASETGRWGNVIRTAKITVEQ